MKKIFITTFLSLSAMLPLATNAAAVQGKTGSFCPGSQVIENLDGKYVERIFIAAEGIRNDGFIHVYADGVKVQRIGVPGYDPDYTFRIRRHVQELRLTFEGTCSRVLDFKVFTPVTEETGKRYSKTKALDTSWGDEVLKLVDDVDNSTVNDNLGVDQLYTRVLKPLKKIAMYTRASEHERHARSLVKTQRALEMAKIIRDNRTYLFEKLDRSENEYLVADLLVILEDILEHTDVKQNKIQETVDMIKADLEE